MADRQTKVTLALQMQQYVDGMHKAAKATRETASEAQKLAQMQEAFTLLGRTTLTAGGVMAAGLAVVVAKFAEFDKAMSDVKAATSESAENMDLLRAAALEAGATTVYSATESAHAIEELGKAGLTTSDILSGGLAGSLDLAAAGGIAVADAAGIAATTLQQFELSGDKASHVADLLAAGANKAMGDVSDLSQALNQSGLIANQFGLSVEETVGSLAAFASAGLLGSDAGTSFRTMLLRLGNPTKESSDLMKSLGISAYDAGGNFVGMASLAGQLQTAMSDLSQETRDSALATIFGSDAIRAANVLYKEGAEGIAQWTENVDDAGFASETAATKLDNLKGDWEALSGAVDTAMISMGEAANGPLRYIVQSITELVDKFNEMPEGGQQAVFWITAAGAAALTAYGSYLLLVPKIAEYNAALATMGPNAARAGRALATMGKGIGITAAIATAVTLAADALVEYSRAVRGTDDAVAKATTTNQSFLKSMDDLGVTTEATAEGVIRALDALATGNTAGSVGFDILTLRDALAELDKGMEALPLEDAAKKFQRWGDELGLSRGQMATLLDEMPGLRDAVRKHLTATGEAADRQAVLNFLLEKAPAAATGAADAIAAIAEEADEAEDNLSAMEEALRGVAAAALEMGDAKDAALGAINSLNEAAKAEGVTLDGVDDASIALRDSMREVEQSHRDAADAILKNGGTLQDARTEWERGREAVIQMRESMGESREEAILWADQNMGSASDVENALRDVAAAVGGIPDKKAITLTVYDTGARATIDSFVRAYNGTTLRLNVGTDSLVIPGGRPGRANGGEIYGSGAKGVDSVPIMAAPGEHMLTAADVDAMGGQHAVYAFREQLHGGGGSSAARGISISQTIQPAPGMSEAQIARIAAEKMTFALRGN
jgi:TP901 family phage tail tape measure protein